VDLFNLGNLFLSDFLAENEEPRCEPVDLQLEWDSELNCARLKQTADPSFMYGRYWYRSGTNQTMKDELAGIVSSAIQGARQYFNMA
jgi:hypothetical protein